MMIEMPPTGPFGVLSLLNVLVVLPGEVEVVLNTRKLLPSKTEVSTITFFIVVSLSVRIKNGVLAFFIFGGIRFNDGFTIYAISKNDAKKNPGEHFQRDVENKR
jgi:hypothetical protein